MRLHGLLSTTIVICLIVLVPKPGRSSLAEVDRNNEIRVAQTLVEHGFENVAVQSRRETLSVWYENRIYRNEVTALGAVAALSAAELDGSRVLEIIPQNLSVPLLTIAATVEQWLAFLIGDATAEAFRQRLRVVADRPPAPPSRRSMPAKMHSSHWKLDLTVRPLLAFELGIADDPLQYSLWLAPELTTSPATGTLLTSQVHVLVKDDMDPFARNVSPGRNTLSWVTWLPGSWLFASTGGYFSGSRYGVAASAGRILRDGTVEIRLDGDISGLLKFSDHLTSYSRMSTWSCALAATHRTRGIDLETTLTAARFMEGALGAQVEVARRYGETRLGFFGIWTEQDKVAGFGLRVPLPGARRPDPTRLRVTGATSLPIRYRDSLNNVGLRVRHVNDVTWVRAGLEPTYVLNNIEQMRRAWRFIEPGEEAR